MAKLKPVALIDTMKKFPLEWEHTPADPNILRPVNEYHRKKGQFREFTLMQLVGVLQKNAAYANVMKAIRKKAKFKTTDRRQFAWVPMSQILIDEDIQRELEQDHALNILKNFDPRRISVIYATKDVGKDVYHSTDGQHNSVVQAVLWAENYWGDLAPGEELLLPVMYVETDDRSFARDDFNWNNGKGKKPVDDHVMLRTNVFKYRIDGKRDKESVKAHEQVKALEDNNCTPTRKKDKMNSGRAGAVTHIAGVIERDPAVLRFIAKMHDTYWTDSNVPAVELGFYETFYKEYIVEQKIEQTNVEFNLFMDQVNAIVKRVFGSPHNMEAQVEKAHGDWYRAVHGNNVKVPSTSNDVKAAVVCRIYEKLGGAYPILEDAVIHITHMHDMTDFLSDEVQTRIKGIK